MFPYFRMYERCAEAVPPDLPTCLKHPVWLHEVVKVHGKLQRFISEHRYSCTVLSVQHGTVIAQHKACLGNSKGNRFECIRHKLVSLVDRRSLGQRATRHATPVLACTVCTNRNNT